MGVPVIIGLLYSQTAINDRRQQLETNIIPYLSLAGSAEILPTTHKVRIVLTPLQRWDAYGKVRCARDARSITLYYDCLSWQSSGYAVFSFRGSVCSPSFRLSEIQGMKKARSCELQKSTKALRSKNRCAIITDEDIWIYQNLRESQMLL